MKIGPPIRSQHQVVIQSNWLNKGFIMRASSKNEMKHSNHKPILPKARGHKRVIEKGQVAKLQN